MISSGGETTTCGIQQPTVSCGDDPLSVDLYVQMTEEAISVCMAHLLRALQVKEQVRIACSGQHTHTHTHTGGTLSGVEALSLYLSHICNDYLQNSYVKSPFIYSI